MISNNCNLDSLKFSNKFWLLFLLLNVVFILNNFLWKCTFRWCVIGAKCETEMYVGIWHTTVLEICPSNHVLSKKIWVKMGNHLVFRRLKIQKNCTHAHHKCFKWCKTNSFLQRIFQTFRQFSIEMYLLLLKLSFSISLLGLKYNSC